jgi:hypothetical protein
VKQKTLVFIPTVFLLLLNAAKTDAKAKTAPKADAKAKTDAKAKPSAKK